MFLRGNLEMSGGLVRTVIVKGPESYFGGSVLGLRYNFIQPGAKLIPYQSFGGRRMVRFKGGEPLIANRLHIYVFHWGRFSLRRKFSLQRDGRRIDQHLSNAWLSNPDYGVDSLGVSVGIQVRY